jgi:hypothetical protein
MFVTMCVLCLTGLCSADSTTATIPYNWNMKQCGFLGLEGGEIVKGIQDENNQPDGSEISKSWQERFLFNYGTELSLSKRLHLFTTIECQMSFSYPYDQTAEWEDHQPQFSFYPDRAEAVYSIGNIESPYLQVGFGYFPFKTDPDAKNLGDYLFRTGTYPVYVINTFNRPYARLLGLRVSSMLFNDLHKDILLTSSVSLPPLVDGSLSYLVSYSLFRVVDVGAGISFAHLFPVDNHLTTPQDPTTSYIKAKGDTSHYTFAGTKPMVRFAIDPKPLIPWDGFGKDDFRLYGEVCITGWEDYNNYNITVDTSAGGIGNYYANRKDRTLYMLGFNVPTCKFLDVLSGELEWFPDRYPNNGYYMFGQTNLSLPKPHLTPSMGTGKVYPLYWSVYIKKTIVDKCALILQFARDHMRPINNNYQYQYTEDVLERKGDWWWAFRLNVSY